MKRTSIRAAALLLAFALSSHLHAQGSELQRAKKELQDAEEAYFEHQLQYPSCDNAANLKTFMQEAATKAEVKDFRATAGASSEIPATPYRFERLQIAGTGSWLDVMTILHRVALFRIGRVGDFESLRLTAAADQRVAFDGTVVAGCLDVDSKALDVDLRPSGSVDATILAAYRERTKKLKAAMAQLDAMEARMQPQRFFDALVLLADAWSDRGVRLSELQYTVPALTLHGIALSAGGQAAVETALHKPGYDAPRVDWSPSGDCHAFTATARLNASAPERGEALPLPLFATAPCAAAPAKAEVTVTKRGTGGLTLHLRNVDINTVFYALNGLSPKDGFILDPGLSRRVDVNFDDVTMDEALAALRSAGAAFTTSGPLHRVCAKECKPPAPGKPAGEPITITVTEADVIDILRTFAQITGLEIRAPRTLQGRLSMYVTDQPWDEIFDVIFAAFGQTSHIDGNVLYLGDRAKTLPVDELRGLPAVEGLRMTDPRKMAAADLRIAGFGGANGTWTAYARVPGAPKMTFALTPKSTFADANVTAVAADKVTLRTTAGRSLVLQLE